MITHYFNPIRLTWSVFMGLVVCLGLLGCSPVIRTLRTSQANGSLTPLVPTSPVVPVPSGFSDDFDNGIIGSEWMFSADPSARLGHFLSSLAVPVSESGGGLRIDESLNEYRANGLETVDSYDFTGATTSVEITTFPFSDGLRYREGGLWLINQNFDGYEIYVAGDTISFGTYLNNTSFDMTSLPFDPVNHKWLRIHHDVVLDQILFQAAPDGATWTTLRTMARALPIDDVHITIYGLVGNEGNGLSGFPVIVSDHFSTNALKF